MKKYLYVGLGSILYCSVLFFLNNPSYFKKNSDSLVKGTTTGTRAFPTAEGFGMYTVGGRGGKVYEVTNTNDSGAGSLRACVEASGARTCIFKVGGLITLNNTLTIKNPYLTIAGQSAPGGGITIKKANGGDVFSTQTHDVIIRYISARPGAGGSNHANQIAKNGIELYNIVMDHNSFSWGVDSNIETWYRVINTTMQWNIVSEGLDCSTHPKGCHSKGLMIGGYAGSNEENTKGSENITISHNLMAHNAERNPLTQVCGVTQIVNNTTYNPAWTFAHQQFNCVGGEGYVNWIGNYHKKGPDSTSGTDLKALPSDDGIWSPGKIYVSGNLGPARTSEISPDSNWVDTSGRKYIVTVPAAGPEVTTTNATTGYNEVLASAGNNKGLNCDGSSFMRRDQIDTRVVNDVKNGTGRIIDDPSEVGGWIIPETGQGCTDSDHDGMPDVWENLKGLNVNNSADGVMDNDNDGYTNLEEYLNETEPGLSETIPTQIPTSILVPTATNIPTSVVFPTATNKPTATLAPTIKPTTTKIPTVTNKPTATIKPTVKPTAKPTVKPTSVPVVPTGTKGDTKAPQVNIIYPSNNSKLDHDNKISVYTRSSDNIKVTKLEFYIDGTLKCSFSNPSKTNNCKTTVTRVYKKVYPIVVKAYDASGNVGTDTISQYASH